MASQHTLTPTWLDWPETKVLIKAFARKKAPLRFVGGAVRDAVLGREVTDVDAATPLLPEAVIALLEKSKIKAVPTGLAHGTVTAVIDARHFEITTLRRDVATDGRHAEVQYTDNWQADAARRDFTMNALYLSPEGELFDYFDGIADAKNGDVRFIGDPALRVSEDYLRILRFFRFHAHYAEVNGLWGMPDEAALMVCMGQAALIETLSGERIQHEVMKLLAAKEPSHTLQMMQTVRVLPYALGLDLRDVEIFVRLEELERALDIRPEPIVRLAAFLYGIGAHMAKEEALDILTARLRLSNQRVKALLPIAKHHKMIQPKLSERQQKRALRYLGQTNFKRILWLNWAAGDEPFDELHPYRGMLALAEHWSPPVFPLTGDDLIKIGIQPGKELGELLRELEEEWEAGDYRMGKEELLRRAK